MSKPIHAGQLVRLQTLWSQYARRAIDAGSGDREARLLWASENCGREISSFRDLTSAEASSLIDLLHGELGIPVVPPQRQGRPRRGIADRDRAQAAGTEGRRGGSNTRTIAAAEDLALIDQDLTELGWDRARLDAFLRSASSPLGRRSNPEIRTLADVNRVHWALKRIAERSARLNHKREARA